MMPKYADVFVIQDNWKEQWTRIYCFGQERERALKFLQERERALFPWEGPERVCYFAAYSLDDLRQTHSNWFHRDQVIYTDLLEVPA